MQLTINENLSLEPVKTSDAADIFHTIDQERAYLGEWLPFIALTLLPIMYMIFFLPQTLSDQILQWIGGGVRSLGDSDAISKAQAGLAGLYGMGRGATVRGGGGTSPVPKGANPKQDPKGSSTGEDKAISGSQGVDGSVVQRSRAPKK
ncbi:hypothetical protein [Kingella potus]|uniref:hypothetical protein n=1 Tax=Kingella potus TaxID=265175 RepID=UPI001C49A986|nr:hypothetical protein [Kingella potus]UOO99976.1 hypothetical protein LVJ84_08065 [Kingella potus]